MRHLPIPIAILSCLALTGCVDKSYDLDDIDMTFGTTAHLTLPTSSTSGIYLKNFMNLEEDGVIQYVKDLTTGDSILCVKQKGSAENIDLDINEIRIAKPNINTIKKDIEMTHPTATTSSVTALSGSSPLGKQRLAIPNLPDETFDYVITPDEKFSYSLDDTKAQEISTDVLSLTGVSIEDATMKITMSVAGFPTWLECIYLNDMHLSVPEELAIKKCTFNGSERSVKDNVIALTDEGNNRISLSNGKADIELNITIEGIHTGTHFEFDAHAHELRLHGAALEVDGAFQINTSDINKPALYEYLEQATPEKIEQIVSTGSLKEVMPTSISLTGNAEFDKDFIVQTVSGELLHDVGVIESIKLNDMPDFLNDPDVVLDLANPVLMLRAESGLLEDAKITTSMQISSSTAEKDVETENFTLASTDGTNTALLYLADSPSTPVPTDYTNATRIDCVEGSGTVAGLIRTIPDEVEIKINPVRVVAKDLDITQSIPISIDYEIYVPFTLGPDFQLVYRGNPETGWAEDANDLEDIDVGSIEVKASVKSTLPATLLVSIIPIDTDGNPISSEVLHVSDVEVKADSSMPITISIKPGDGYTMNDVLAGKNGLKRLDGIKYEARIKEPSGNNTNLRKDAMIQLTDIKVTIIGNIIYDAN